MFKCYIRVLVDSFTQEYNMRYCSMRSGTCTFLPDTARKEMSERVHALSSTRPPSESLFEPCMHAILSYLRKQHAIFVVSQQFDDLMNQNMEPDEPTTAFSADPNLPATSGCRACASTSAETLLMEVLEPDRGLTTCSIFRLKSTRRNVAVQSTSKRDSSLSCSAASSEENGNRKGVTRRHADQRLPLQRVQGVSNFLSLKSCWLKYFHAFGSN
ncbi:unnamed protein product [Gongylonema pulchrum]|uniref:RGS domain-containing protein n=1 Tax=Gongylonema pulchrum TaxID=637853 RepID=A0A183EVS7_9BILA|nr:unnamed protein product [Gongylonema pulchrum]